MPRGSYHEEQHNAGSSGVTLGRGKAETDAASMGSKSAVLNETEEVAAVSMTTTGKRRVECQCVAEYETKQQSTVER